MYASFLQKSAQSPLSDEVTLCQYAHPPTCPSLQKSSALFLARSVLLPLIALSRSTFFLQSTLHKQANRLNTCLDLQNAYPDYDAGKIRKEDLVAAQDKAGEDSVTTIMDKGETLITDENSVPPPLLYTP